MVSISPQVLLDKLIDPGTFEHWQVRAGQRVDDESVWIGEATVAGRPVALILSDFAVMAGSIGQAAADQVVAALRTATERRLPVFASPTSGGTRIQEGTSAFVRMIDIAAAAADHRSSGNALVVWLRNPTTGGVMATWGSLGQITYGEPGALAGFLGPRLFEPLTGAPIDAGVQTTDNLARVGVIDAVLPVAELRGMLLSILSVLTPAATASESSGAFGVKAGQAESATRADPIPGSDLGAQNELVGAAKSSAGLVPAGESAEAAGSGATGEAEAGEAGEAEAAEAGSAWDAVLVTRNPDRPGLIELLDCCDDVCLLSGTGAGERCDAVRIALARLGNHGCVIVGQERRAQLAGELIGPAGLRTARRGIRLATELGLPLVTVVDTAGAELSAAAEAGAMAGEIARCLADLSGFPGPSVSVVLGMGCGGGALAMLPADRVLVAANGWVTPLPLEGASLIKYRDMSHARQLAETMGIDAANLVAHGLADEIIPEHQDVATQPQGFLAAVAEAIAANLDLACARPTAIRKASRARRYGSELRAGRANS